MGDKSMLDPMFMGVPLKYVTLIILTIQNTGAIVMMRYTRSTPTESQYLTTTAVVMGELMKCVASSILLVMGGGSLSDIFSNPRELLKTGVPAFLYLIQNNLQYVAVSNLEAATYQVTYQLKILSTAIMAVLLLKKRIAPNKWFALFLLTAGVATVQLSAMPSNSDPSPNVNVSVGLTATLLACGCSGLAGVYFEMILKGSNVDLWVRNIQLGMYSIIIGLAGIYLNPVERAKVELGGFFQGYTAVTLLNILVQGCGGLIIATVIKYADNILKNFATAISIILSALISWMFMDFHLTIMFLCGVILVNYAAYLYGRPEAKVPQSQSQTRFVQSQSRENLAV